MEEWKEIRNTGCEISNHGRARNGDQLLSISVSTQKNRKVCTVSINGESCYVHRLVAIAFLPEAPERPYVRHKDGNIQNNHVDNLEWYAGKRGGYSAKHANNIKRLHQLHPETNKVVRTYPSMLDATKETGKTHKDIRMAVKEKTICDGYLWEYR